MKNGLPNATGIPDMATCSSTLLAAPLANRFEAMRGGCRKRLERRQREFSKNAGPDLLLKRPALMPQELGGTEPQLLQPCIST